MPDRPALVRPTSERAAAILATVSGAAMLAVCSVGRSRSYEYDESVTVGYFVRPGTFTAFTSQRVANNHPLFSFLERLVWMTGAHSEAAMRALPAVFAAATVALVVGWTGRRWGAWSGVAAAAVLITNPLLVESGRTARGYSLLVLAATAATLLLVRLVERPDPSGVWRLAYVIAAAAGLATHLYMLLVLAAHLGLVVSRRRRDAAAVAAGGAGSRPTSGPELIRGWVVTWTAVVLLAGMAYLRTFPMRRPGVVVLRFPLDVATTLAGGSWLAVAALATVVGAALWAHRRDWLFAGLPVLVLAVIWLGLHPMDLYPRFLVWVVPGIAGAAAWAVARRPASAIVVLAAAAVLLPIGAPTDTGSRAAATIAQQLGARGEHVCVVGAEALRAYTSDVSELSPHGRCDAIIDIGHWNPTGIAVAVHRLRHRTVVGDATIYT